jgi:3'-phosphoadenosine 5'-phosphosulfate sulfotransferase (PAPS reductase)/FAD synthetase
MKADNPYLIHGPALIAFSGGRTSGYMLHKIIEAYGGRLPDDVIVTFCNTSKERPETLDFVRECGERWNVPIVCLEWRAHEPGYAVVGHNSMARNGEVFTALLRQEIVRKDATVGRRPLPNPVASSCTMNLKIRVKSRFVRHHLGWAKYNNAVGFRADEAHRFERASGHTAPGETILCPMVHAQIREDQIMEFWKAQPFDLTLKQYEGNCDLCFKKSAGKISRIMRERPDLARWWIDAEAEAASSDRGSPFRIDRPNYASMLDAVQRQDEFDFGLFDDETTCPSHGCTD